MKTYLKKFTSKIIPFIFACTIILFSCSEADRALYEAIPMTDSVSTKALPANVKTTAIPFNKKLDRQFIRTADLKFQVKNVIMTTDRIESIVRQHGGFIKSTELTSQTLDVNQVTVSDDSALVSTKYQVTNSISLRIPNTTLDSTLREISRSVIFLDYRNIKCEDVALQILSNDLAQKRFTKNERRDIDRNRNKVKESIIAEEFLLRRQEEADAAGIGNLSLNDQVNFSTINLSVYEKPVIKRELIEIDKVVEPYQPSFGIKLKDSLKTGWQLMEAIIVVLAKLWVLILLTISVGLILHLRKARVHKL